MYYIVANNGHLFLYTQNHFRQNVYDIVYMYGNKDALAV